MYRKYNQPQSIKSAECNICYSKRLLYSRGKLTCNDCGNVIGATYNKYGRKKTEYNGYNYDSKFEAEVAQDLDLKLKVGEITNVEKQVKISLQAYGKHITNYFIDFVVTHKDGHLEYIEVKGLALDTWKLKWKMLEAKLALEEPSSEMTLIQKNKQKRYS